MYIRLNLDIIAGNIVFNLGTWLSMNGGKAIIKHFLPLAIIAIAGCSSKPTYEVSDIDYKLVKAALSVEDSMRTLAATQEVYAKNAINTDVLITPQGGMGGLTRLDWSGPIEPLLEKIGALTQYRVKILGPVPTIPIVVTISSRERTIADVLKDAGLQAGKRANLVVYPTSRIIELRYAAVV